MPTLVLAGERDQCVPELSKTMAAAIPHAELVVFDAAHLPFFDCPDEYFGVVREFLRRADR